MNPLLTIGIPTYNRSEMLAVLVRRIISLITPDLAEYVEIFVSDNKSIDNTSLILECIMRENPHVQLRLSCNEMNVGFSRNFDRVVRGSKGQFVFFMSNDDGLSDDSLKIVINVLRKYPEIGIGFFESQTYDKSLSYSTEVFRPRKDKYYDNGIDWVLESKSCVPCLISGWLVKREKWLQESKNEWMSSNAIQIPIGMAILAKSACYHHRSSPVVKYRIENGDWSHSSDPLCPYSGLNAYFHGARVVRDLYPHDIYNLIYWQVIRTTCGHTIRNKVLGIPILRQEVERLLQPYCDTTWPNCILTLILRILLRIPRWMLFVPFRWIVPK